jgi:hypothetical protein
MVIDALEFCRNNVFDEKSGCFVAPQGPYHMEWIYTGK